MGGQCSVPNFETGSEKMSAWENLKSPFHRYLLGGLLCFLSKKIVSNVDLSLAADQPINVKLCETFVLLNLSNNITRN